MQPRWSQTTVRMYPNLTSSTGSFLFSIWFLHQYHGNAQDDRKHFSGLKYPNSSAYLLFVFSIWVHSVLSKPDWLVL